MFLQSQLLTEVSGLQHGFGTLNEPVPSVFLDAWDTERPQWKQVHGVAHTEVTGSKQECGEVDALFTKTRGIPIAVQTADCVPVLMSSRDGRHVAAVHAGWRGTQARILYHFWSWLSAQGHSPKDWVAAIGPSIGPCCYEVSAALSAKFFRQFSGAGRPNPVPNFRRLDLRAINLGELRGIGVNEIDVLPHCTSCSRDGGSAKAPFLLHSYRREGAACRQWSVIKTRENS